MFSLYLHIIFPIVNICFCLNFLSYIGYQLYWIRVYCNDFISTRSSAKPLFPNKFTSIDTQCFWRNTIHSTTAAKRYHYKISQNISIPFLVLLDYFIKSTFWGQNEGFFHSIPNPSFSSHLLLMPLNDSLLWPI